MIRWYQLVVLLFFCFFSLSLSPSLSPPCVKGCTAAQPTSLNGRFGSVSPAIQTLKPKYRWIDICVHIDMTSHNINNSILSDGYSFLRLCLRWLIPNQAWKRQRKAPPPCDGQRPPCSKAQLERPVHLPRPTSSHASVGSVAACLGVEL